MSRAVVSTVLIALALGVLGGLASGCTRAEAKPLELTYYYLPG